MKPLIFAFLLTFPVWGNQDDAHSSLTVQSNGIVIGTATTVNIVSGTGVTVIPNVSDHVMTLQVDADVAVMQNRAAAQMRVELNFIPSAFFNSTYSGAMSPTLASYGTGNLMLYFWPDVNGPGGEVSLNIDGLGDVSIKEADCTTDTSSSDIVARRPYLVWFHSTEGTVDAACIAPVFAAAAPTEGTKK